MAETLREERFREAIQEALYALEMFYNGVIAQKDREIARLRWPG